MFKDDAVWEEKKMLYTNCDLEVLDNDGKFERFTEAFENFIKPDAADKSQIAKSFNSEGKTACEASKIEKVHVTSKAFVECVETFPLQIHLQHPNFVLCCIH